jgi:chromosome segregation protein
VFLKSIDIFGFKSFADPTRVEFAEGITALLGPNGCGKSNVVDAIKWVLGEQASKAMRAEKMEDVIFNGTESRKPLGKAEVSLSISNAAAILPLDTPVVKITRKLNRDGESEYCINDTRAKLKEIRELFWDTGVGKAAYSVMEQGKIDQILSSKPDERRYLFEEAAGITKFKAQSAEAERKLAKTEENVLKIELILTEVKHSCDSLKTQADKTLKYRSFRDLVFNLEIDIQLLRLKQFQQERDARTEKLNNLTAERDKVRAEIEKQKLSLDENKETMSSLENELLEYQKTIVRLAADKNALDKEIKILNGQRKEYKAKIEQNEGRERVIESKIEDLTSDLDEQDGVLHSLRKKVLDVVDSIATVEEQMQQVAAQIHDNDGGIRRAEEEIRSFERERLHYEKELETITDSIVAALDAGLKQAGFNGGAEQKACGDKLVELLSQLKIQVSGRGRLLLDLVAAADREEFSPLDVKKIAQKLSLSLAEAVKISGEALELFKEYQKTAPAFLDDFLAPGGIITKKRSLDAAIRASKDAIEQRRESIAALRAETEKHQTAINEQRAAMEELRVVRMQMATQSQAAEEAARLIKREFSGQEALRKQVQDELGTDRRRLEEITERIEEGEQEIADIEQKGRTMSSQLEDLEQAIQRQSAAISDTQNIITRHSEKLNTVQEALEKIHLALVQAEMEIKNVADNFRESHSRDIHEFESRIPSITAPPDELREKLANARGGLKGLGSVNFMAPEEYTQAKDRYDFLSKQLADLTKARDDLEIVTREIRTQSSKLFFSTYNKIRKNFHIMFRRLFGGGRAELRLQDPEHILESGIEIFAQPPGKKLENIALLSGGERSMTAVALLFATYKVKPSPFCLLDEIDAALDEVNVHRFVALLKEFGDTSQFIVITHNKKTVIGAGTLIGVTMEESGITKVISVRLEHEEGLQDDTPFLKAADEAEAEDEATAPE